jgi:hypothetical protein
MRDALRARYGQRLRFSATVERFGSRSNWHGYPEPTILFRDVRFADTDAQACDHLWFRCGAWSAGLAPGDQVMFDARVDSYEKGYQGGKAERLGLSSWDIDYHLERPTKVTIVRAAAEEEVIA